MKGSSITSWSGGKDSCYALYQSVKLGLQPTRLLTVLNEEGYRSRSHGIPAPVLAAQAAATGIPATTISASWASYETTFTKALQEAADAGITHAVFGDIDLQAHRDWEENVCAAAGLQAVLPLWQRNRTHLLREMLEWGMETVIVSCNAVMGGGFIGQTLTAALIPELEALGIDPCGENGEFHTLVLNCPLFKERLSVTVSQPAEHEGYWFGEVWLG